MNEGIERLGGWDLYEEGQFKEHTKIKTHCKCQNNFIVTKTKNVKTKLGLIFLNWISSKNNNVMDLGLYDKVIQHFSVCPNCSKTRLLFCEKLRIHYKEPLNVGGGCD